MSSVPSLRAQIVEARTYLRPLDPAGTVFETPEQAVDRVIEHQRWLWRRAIGKRSKLNSDQEAELSELRQLFLDRKAVLAGRTRWLGGTEIAKKMECSQFNCAFAEIRTVHDVVDAYWLLLQNCGVGFRPVVGTLNGFTNKMDIEIVHSKRGPYDKGSPRNFEHYDPDTGVWTIIVGDSSEAWAKSIGKILAGKYPAKKLRLDFTQIRGPGARLRRYGWISAGDEQISKAYAAVAEIMNRRAGELLTRIDILDIINWIGTTLSSRRAAEIAIMGFNEPEWEEFATAKKDYWSRGLQHRSMSNNSLLFYQRPTRYQLNRIFKMMMDSGGSEPGFINAQAAFKRAAYFKGVNPCGEVMLGDRSFCNLSEVVVSRFNGDETGLHRAIQLIARANYRQTCVNLEDGILQSGWHQLNQFLRLCGVGVTGVVAWEYQNEPDAWNALRECARLSADGMADELHLPRAKLVTTIKPSGTNSKSLGNVGDEVPEGIHKPLGRYIFNNIRFSEHDPLVEKFRAANYHVFPDPNVETDVIIRVPVEYPNIEFDIVSINGEDVEINLESAISQLNRYLMVMKHYVDHNCSITVSYDPSEVPEIIDWLIENWNDYVGVTFLYRNDPTKTAQDLGHAYLPQEVVTRSRYENYVRALKPVSLTNIAALDMMEEAECAGGACPIR